MLISHSQMRLVLSTLVVLLACHQAAAAFRPCMFQPALRTRPTCDDTALRATRRDFVEKAAISSIAAVAASFALSRKVEASGGATAGGVYLLSVRPS
jgi:hypothetical protein